MTLAIAELNDVELEIEGAQGYKAMLSPEVSCNVIEKACLETLQQPWARLDREVDFHFHGHASAPLGICPLSWSWQRSPTTEYDIFVVVEKVNRNLCNVILGAASHQRPAAKSSDDIFAFGMKTPSKGTTSSRY